MSPEPAVAAASCPAVEGAHETEGCVPGGGVRAAVTLTGAGASAVAGAVVLVVVVGVGVVFVIGARRLVVGVGVPVRVLGGVGFVVGAAVLAVAVSGAVVLAVVMVVVVVVVSVVVSAGGESALAPAGRHIVPSHAWQLTTTSGAIRASRPRRRPVRRQAPARTGAGRRSGGSPSSSNSKLVPGRRMSSSLARNSRTHAMSAPLDCGGRPRTRRPVSS